jgi:hypothetical protein
MPDYWAKDDADPIGDLRRARDHIAGQTGFTPNQIFMSSRTKITFERWEFYREQLELMVERLPWWSPTRHHANALLKKTMGTTTRDRLRWRWNRFKWRHEDY